MDPGAYCIKLLPEKNSGYFNQRFFSYGKVNGTNHADLSFSPVKVLCNGPQDFKMGGGGGVGAAQNHEVPYGQGPALWF